MPQSTITPTPFSHKVLPSRALPPEDPLCPSWSYDLSRLILGAWFRIFHFVKYTGRNAIPRQGPLIFCPNHISYYDPPLVGIGIPFGTSFMAWDALFSVPVLGAFIRSVGAFPVKLKTADKGAIEQTIKVLRGKGAVVIFPEGGRSFTGELMPFEVGAFRMAVQTASTIVPVSVIGMFEAWSPHDAFPNLFRPLIVKYHTPIVVSADIPRSEVKSTVEQISNEVRRVITRRQNAYKRLKQMRAARGVWGGQ